MGSPLRRRRTWRLPRALETTRTGRNFQVIGLDTVDRCTLELPGRPRWCVVDAEKTRVFLAIRDPTMVLTARLPDLSAVERWPLPSGGAHGMDIDHNAHLLYIACDDGALVEMHTQTGKVTRQ